MLNPDLPYANGRCDLCRRPSTVAARENRKPFIKTLLQTLAEYDKQHVPEEVAKILSAQLSHQSKQDFSLALSFPPSSVCLSHVFSVSFCFSTPRSFCSISCESLSCMIFSEESRERKDDSVILR